MDEQRAVRPPGAEIATEAVGVLREYTGRGPTKAKTMIHDDVVTVLLADTLTKGERSLARDGREQLVLSNRKAYQQTMSTDLIATVEQLTGRTVLAFLSDNHMNPDIAVESFVLVPLNGDGGDPAASAG